MTGFLASLVARSLRGPTAAQPLEGEDGASKPGRFEVRPRVSSRYEAPSVSASSPPSSEALIDATEKTVVATPGASQPRARAARPTVPVASSAADSNDASPAPKVENARPPAAIGAPPDVPSRRAPPLRPFDEGRDSGCDANASPRAQRVAAPAPGASGKPPPVENAPAERRLEPPSAAAHAADVRTAASRATGAATAAGRSPEIATAEASAVSLRPRVAVAATDLGARATRASADGGASSIRAESASVFVRKASFDAVSRLSAAPSVRVSIGRIELRAAFAPEPAAPPPRRSAPPLSLDEYLKRRERG